MQFRSRGVGRAMGHVLLCLMMAPPVLVAAASGAAAFELFGLQIFGPSEDETADVVDPTFYTVTLNVEGDDEELKEALEAASGLIADEERPVSGSLGLLAKARNEREVLIAALYSDARYDGVVTITIDGRPLDELPPDAEFDRSRKVPVEINVAPGGVFVLGDVSLVGDSGGLDLADVGLIRGGDAGSDAILKAEAQLLERLQEQGRPLAVVEGREVVADHATMSLDVTLRMSAGPVAPFGETTVEGTQDVDAAFTAYMAGIEPGKTFTPKDIEAARKRLVELGVFSSVTVTPAEALNAYGQVPVMIEVSERKFRYYGVGATFSNTEGFGLEGYWGHRNLFGRAESLRIEGSIGRIADTSDYTDMNYSAGVLFEKPGVLGPDSKFFANFKTVQEHPDAYERFSTKAGVGLQYKLSETQTVSAEAAIDYSRIIDAYDVESRHLLVSLPVQYVFDNRDNKLDPTGGFRAMAFVEPTYDIRTGNSFVKVKGEGSTYIGLDANDDMVLALRMAGGSLLGAELSDVPADRRFYSGGGGSVRGYAYQGIGPKNVDDKPTGGLSFAEFSAEMRFRITDTIGIVPFVDAGTVSNDTFPDFSELKVGAGIGLRYLTPFGPLRIDAAVPLNPGPGDPSFGIYAGVGQAF